ncbi:MAG: matrixin family metalloprotease [Candidatus Hinthialibacter sp.]
MSNGTPVLWPENNRSLIYILDQGGLGKYSAYKTANMISDAFKKWNDVSTKTLQFSRDPNTLSVDVTVDNYPQSISNLPSGKIPIIYDEDGEIIESLMGVGAKKQILGFATVYSSGTNLVAANAIFNGYFIRVENQSENEIISTLLHEIGHIAGLDHSQQLRELAYNNVDSDNKYVPIMFPSTTFGEDARNELTFDDKTSISNLYPTLFYQTSTGSIEGTVQRSGNDLPGVNVIARSVDDPVAQVSSTVTGTLDYMKGTYHLKGLPPGDYEVMIESIDRSFTGASSVGRYSETLQDLSFRQPVESEYYNENDQTYEGRSVSSAVTVKRNRAVSRIDFNVSTQSLSSDEQSVNALRLLAVNSSAAGAAAKTSLAPNFLLVPEGDEPALELTVEFTTITDFRIRISREVSPNNFTVYSFSEKGRAASVTFGNGGDIPLESTRYFIEVANFSSFDRSFNVSVNEIDSLPTPTPSPTFTPSPTLTSTFTPTPTDTPFFESTPTYTSTPADTPTAKLERTPTPVLLDGDVNLDGRVDVMDIFAFSQDWRKPATSVQFRSNLSRTRSLVIDHNDLLELIDALSRDSN